MMNKHFLVVVLLCFTESLALKRAKISRYERRTNVVDDRNDEFAWVSPDELVRHIQTLARTTGAPSPYKLPGYSPSAARKLHRYLSKKGPKLIDHIVNLGHHFAGSGSSRRRSLSGKEKVPDVAKKLRMAHQNKLRFLQAIDIDTCPAEPGCEHDPCTKTYLDDAHTPFDPAYGGTGGYNAAVASIKSTAFWNGEPETRTETDGASANVIALAAATIAKEISGALCDTVDDDIKVCILCAIFELPNPAKIVCEVADALLDYARLALDSINEQINYQDGLVQGAEIEASYEHTRNLLHKQCAIFDEAQCRCSESLEQDAWGLGCDGKDSNCNDEIDECDEDKIAPIIDIDATLKRCGGFFATIQEAETCILESVVATDDCQAVTVTVIDSGGTCDTSYVTIRAQEAVCGKFTDATITVFVDGAAPTLGCGFANNNADIEITGPRIPTDVGFYYTASDVCGKPMNVTVDVYASEIEDFNAQEMALFFRNNNANDVAELYLAAHTCSTVNNGQCIKDPAAQDARLYTAIVSATDVAGNSAEEECQVRIVPKGNLRNKDISTEDSVQRFHLTSYTSLWTDFAR